MIKNPAFQNKQYRSSQRNKTTLLSSGSNKDIILSSKDLKKARSIKNIDFTNFIENKNDKIKDIDEKLQVHQEQINRNNHIIEELNQNFVNLKLHLDKEKENVLNEERKNKLLRDEIERTNKILRTKNSKIQQLNKKVADNDKQIQNLKLSASKSDEYSKTIVNLRAKMTSTEESMTQLKHIILQKQKQIVKMRQKLSLFDQLKLKQQQSRSQMMNKDVLIGNLKQVINELNRQKSLELNDKLMNQSKIERLNGQIFNLQSICRSLKQKNEENSSRYEELKHKFQKVQVQLKDELHKNQKKDRTQEMIKIEINDFKTKIYELNNAIDQKNKQINKRDSKIQKMNQKIKQLEVQYGQNYKEKQKYKQSEDKVQQLKNKVDGLNSMFKSITPQIQCPFGHELHNPVTIIPCGHNYCLGCKKGYTKQCMQCSGKLKIEAVYRNELMDDIIGIVGGIKQVIQILK